ncbi:MAG: PTS sugar transporter subunit IIA, partial [Coriobacteriaceae bacterium]|nr:PTS sugar transporter subunit IIA [Coriobacteriaceae bacterium]
MMDFVKADQVFLDVVAKDVDEALVFLSGKVVELGISDDEAAVLAAFKSREADGTTGMMSGFAIPHCKSNEVKGAAILVAKFAEPVAWESMDGNPISVALALCVPDNKAGTTYLRVLSQVAVMLMDEEFRDQILATNDRDR